MMAAPDDDHRPQANTETKAGAALRFPLVVAVCYAVVSGAWIVASDHVVSALFAENITTVQTYKGWVFILVTAILLFLVLLRESRQRREVETALRSGEERLRRERGLFEAVLHQAPIGISIASAPDGKSLVLNDRIRDILQMAATEEDASRYAGYGARHEDGRPYAVEDYPTVRALRHGEVVEREPMLYRRPDGREIELEVSSTPVRNDDGGIAAAVTILVDITDPKATKRALAESGHLLRRAIDDAPFPIIVHAEDGEIVHISRVWLETTGYRRDEIPTVADWTARAYGDRDAAVRADIDRLYELDRPIDEGEYTIRTADGRTRLWAFRSSPIGRDPTGRRLVVSMAADLTDRREAEGRLRLLMREVDHRAKNALAVVQSIVMLSRAEDPAEFASAVEGRVTAMARAHALLTASRWSGADLATLAQDELGAFAQAGRFAVSGPPVAIAPEAAQSISMVLHELVTNAAKYGALSVPDGQVAVSWREEPATGRMVLRWTESGGPPVTPPTRHGFGSTLLEQTVLGQLRGDLDMDWHPAGLRCRMALPRDCFVVSGVRPAPEQPAGAANDHKPVIPGARVMVVEDEALTALGLEQVLRTAGYDVLGPVGRVQEAIDLARQSPPDAAVLDVNLFGQPSFPVAEALDAMGVPFLFCTGYGSLDTTDERLRKAPILSKPVPPDRLVGAVGALLAAGTRPATGVVPS